MVFNKNFLFVLHYLIEQICHLNKYVIYCVCALLAHITLTLRALSTKPLLSNGISNFALFSKYIYCRPCMHTNNFSVFCSNFRSALYINKPVLYFNKSNCSKVCIFMLIVMAHDWCVLLQKNSYIAKLEVSIYHPPHQMFKLIKLFCTEMVLLSRTNGKFSERLCSSVICHAISLHKTHNSKTRASKKKETYHDTLLHY